MSPRKSRSCVVNVPSKVVTPARPPIHEILKHLMAKWDGGNYLNYFFKKRNSLLPLLSNLSSVAVSTEESVAIWSLKER